MSDEDLDWDDDFDFGDDGELKTRTGDGAAPQVVLSGVAANPDEEENWDDDFDLEDLATSSGKNNTLGRTPAKPTKVIDVSALNQVPQVAVPEGDRAEKLFGAIKSQAKAIDKLIRPSHLITNDMITQNSPKTPSRLRRSETGDLYKTPSVSRSLGVSQDLYKTPMKFSGASIDLKDAIEDETWRQECATLEEDLEKAAKRGESVAQANLAWKLGMLYKSHSAAIDAMTHFETAKDVLEKLDEFLLEELDFSSASLPYQMGITTRILQDIVQAQVYFKEAIKNALTLNDRKVLVDSYLEMGYCLFRLEQWLQSLDYYNSFLSELCSEADKPLSNDSFEALAHVCYNIAICCQKSSQIDLATKYCRKALTYSKDTYPALYTKVQQLLNSIQPSTSSSSGASPTSSVTLEKGPSGSHIAFKGKSGGSGGGRDTLRPESPWNSDSEFEPSSTIPKLKLGSSSIASANAKASGATRLVGPQKGPANGSSNLGASSSALSGSTASIPGSSRSMPRGLTSDDEATRSSKEGSDSDDDWAKDFDDEPSGGGIGTTNAGNSTAGGAATTGTTGSKPLLKMQLLLSENIQSDIDEVAPFKLLPERGDVNIVTVIYPKPSILYSMKTTTGHNQLSETDLDAWLQNLVLKYRGDLLSWKERQSELSSQRDNFYNVKMKSLKPMTREWCTEMLGFAHNLCSQGHTRECWKLIVDFFNHAKTYITTHKSLKGSRLVVAGNLAFIASRLWTPASDSEFKKILAIMGKLAPLHTIASKIMLAETLAHHFTGKSTILPLLTEAYDDAEKELKNLDKQEASLKTMAPTNASANTSPSQSSSSTPTTPKNKSLSTASSDGSIPRTDSASSLNSSSNSSETTSLSKKEILIKRTRAHCKTMQARVLANINLFFLDRSMLTTRIQQSLEDSSNDDYGDDTYLCDDAVRINLLMKIYPTLEHGWEKAKAALALGLSATISQDYDLAERLLFECIYMLDTMPSNVPGLKPIVSELGSSALTAFGQVLADNYKYKYSVPAIDGALLLCDMRGRIEDYYSLLRTAARLAQNEGDLPRAIDLYTEIVEHYRAEQRINEAVYVNELLCTMHIENGSFQQAINCLQRASESLPDYTRFFDETAPKNSSFDPGFLRLQLQTAKTLLTSYHWDKSIDLLEQIARYRQPAPLMVATYELLARAFLKKRSFAEADSWLDTWRDYQKEQLSVDGRLFLSRRYSVSAHNANMTYDVAYYALKAKNYFYANKFAEALEFIDKAILFSSATRLASLGKHYFLRGRILRRLCRVAFSMPFPTTLKPAAASGTLTMPQTATAGLSSPRAIDILELPPHVFERPGDLLQECVATYRQAYNYFKLTGDDCKIAKALSDMAEAYLEFLFWPVASSESTFDELSSFPLFKVSMIATNAREEQRQNVINLDRKQTQAQHAASISTHHSSSQSHPTSTAASGTTTPLADSEGESSTTKSRVSVDRAKDSSTVSTPGPASANPGSTLQSSGSVMGSTKLGVLTPKGANSHKRSQSAVPATSVATSVSSSTGLDQSTSSGSPRDVSPDPHSASSGPGSGKLPGDPKANVVSRSQSRHRSDKMKKKVSMSKVTTIRDGTGNGSSSPSGVSITTSNDKISPPPAPLGDKGSGPPSDKGVNERLMDKRSTSGVSGKKSDLKESGSKKKGSDIESALGGRGDNDSGDEGDGNDQGNGASLPSFVISLKTIENAAKLALDISSYTGNILMALNGYLNMAEIRYLEGKHEIATSFWIECTEQLSNYFLNGSQFILSDAPPSFLQRMFIMVKRAVRFLFFLPKAVINRNLYMVDLFLALENDLEQQLKKAVGSQVFGTYIGSDASLPRSLFSLKLQKKYRTERTTSVTQLNPPMGSSPSAQSPLAAALAKEEKNLVSANSSASLKSELSFGSGSSTSSLSTNSSASSTLGGLGTNSGNGGASGPKPSNPMAIFNTIDEGGISRSNASLIWGYYFYLRQQQKRYGEGKLTREELKVRYTKSLKVMLKLATVARTQETEYIKEWNKRMTSVMTRKSSRMLLTHTPLRKSAAPASVGANQVSASTTGIPANPMDTLTKSIDRADRERTDSMAALGGSPMKNPSFEEIITNRNTKLANLVYILQLDDRLVQYVPSSGKRCVQLIGKREQLANSTSPRQVPTHVFMKIHLLDLREDFVTLAIPSDMTLHDVITYLLTRDNWDDEVNPQGVSKDTSDGSKKSSGIGAKTGQFFSALLGGLGSGSSTAAIWPADRIEKVDKSANFYDEFRHLLSWVGDETTPDPTPSISLGGSASDVGGNANPASSPRGKRANSISADRPPSLGRGSISESRPPSLGRSSSISEARPPSLKTILEADSSEGSTKLPSTPSKSPRHQHKGGDVSSPSKLPPGPSTSSAPALDAKIQESQASYLPPIPSGISLSSGLHASRNSDDIAMAGQTSPNSSGSASFALTTKSPTRPQTVPISLITLAKRKERKSQNSLHAGNLIPLRSKLHKKVYECFSNGELSKNSSTQPLNVFLFISSRNARTGAFNASVSNTIHFSDEVSAYLHGLAGTSMKETSPNLEQILLELAQLFAPLLEILPLSRRPDHPYNLLSADIKTYWKAFCGELDDRTKIPQRVLDAQDTGSGGIVSRCPLSIICSKYMHVIPWELFLPTESVLRYFALEDAAGRHTRMPVKHSTSRKIKKKVNLSFLQCYYSQSFRNIQQQEIIRKSWILQNVNNHLNLTNDRFAADYSGDNSPIFPFHASTVTNPRRIAHYRSKYKHITFIDLWHYVMNPQEIVHIADHIDTPILILSYADLLEMSTSLLNIVRSKRTPTLVFVPEAHLKEVTIRLGKRHSSAIKQEDANTEDGYQFLMNLVLSVSKELSVPIVVINPPAL